jgi:hypothetical protein
VDSVVALFSDADVIDNGNGTSTLQTQNFGAALNLCAAEPFRDQPIGAFCSGFLVAQDIIATAGHCVNANDVTNVRFVFGFRMRNAAVAETVINNTEIYRGVNIIGRQLVGNGADWALVRIDRPVTNHRIAQIRQFGRIDNTQAVHVIGHPSGLPTKFANGAAVRDNQPNAFFVANLDTYGGNSGSPVFNSDTHEVEGSLSGGKLISSRVAIATFPSSAHPPGVEEKIARGLQSSLNSLRDRPRFMQLTRKAVSGTRSALPTAPGSLLAMSKARSAKWVTSCRSLLLPLVLLCTSALSTRKAVSGTRSALPTAPGSLLAMSKAQLVKWAT